MRRHVLLAIVSISFFAAGCSSEKPHPIAPAKAVAAPELKGTPPATTDVEAAEPAAPPASSPAEKRVAENKADSSNLPAELLALFKQLDELGRDRVKDAKFVRVTFSRAGLSKGQESSEDAWLVEEDDSMVTLLQADLIPWVYSKKSATTIPQSWEPAVVKLTSVEEAKFEAVCKSMSEPEGETADKAERVGHSLYSPGPSRRLLVAHAAWKKGLSKYCESIVSIDPKFREDKDEFHTDVLDDLGWLHFLRGVNLLMFSDRKEVLPHLRLVSKLAPKAEFAADVDDLTNRLERLIADVEQQEAKEIDKTQLSESEKAELYVSQLRDLHCAQMSQPGDISPYMGFTVGRPKGIPPSTKLRNLGMAAVPTLIQALEDDTPTRTVYAWRDFHRSRLVWRVSDFAWTILRDITKKDFGDQRVVGFTLSFMKPQQKQSVIEAVKKWYAESKNLSPDDRMFAFFSSEKPDDWMTAGQYLLKKKDSRAVAALLKNIPRARQFSKGNLCELVARFGDPSAKAAILDVLNTADEASDQLSAAISLWQLGDASGVPVVIEYVKANTQPYGSWDDPVWFLMRSHTPEGIETLESVVIDGPITRAAEVLGFIGVAITGDLWGKKRPPAACLEICPLLIAAMKRNALTGGSINDVKIRFKDSAAKSLALMRQGWDARSGGRFAQIDPKLFKESEPDEAKRDEQIEALTKWYEDNKDRLVWDAKARKLAVKAGNLK